MDQQQVLQSLWLALYFLVGVGVLAAKTAAEGAPDTWSPLGMLRGLERASEKDESLEELLSSYPVRSALVVAVFWVVMVLAWPLLLLSWAWHSATRRAGSGDRG